MTRKWVIGDIRGELNLLNKLIQKIGPSESDQLIFTGSYLGPGPDSKGVVDTVLELGKLLPNIAFLRGCYEYVFGFCIGTRPTREAMFLWSNMQGNKVFQSYASNEALSYMKPNGGGKSKYVEAEIPLKIPETHLIFLENLHQWFEDDTYPYVVCHSGGHPLLFGGSLQSEDQTVFPEKNWWLQDGRRIPSKTVIFSHVPFKEPFSRAGKLGIDLGAGFGGKLCAFEMFSQTFAIVGE